MDDDWPDQVTFPRADSAGGPVAASRAAVEVADPHGLIGPAQLDLLTSWAAAAAARLDLTGEVRVRLVDDSQMAFAHERYSGIPGTTDVLTFDLREPAEAGAQPHRMDVDLYVCVDEARRQAAARARALEPELLLYIVHGVLHCLGEDDHDDAAYARMHAREDELLQAIGVGPVFNIPTPSPPPARADGGAG